MKRLNYRETTRWQITRGRVGAKHVWLVYAPAEREPRAWFHLWENAITYVGVVAS